MNQSDKKRRPMVLVIEDEPLLLKSIEVKIKNSPLDVTAVKSAESAIDYLKQKKLPDFIWLDFYLKGGMSGLDFMKELHENPSWAGIPVIVVSNTASEEKVNQMLALGAKHYFLKAENLLADIIQFIESYSPKNDA